jgi:hypothetical protein
MFFKYKIILDSMASVQQIIGKVNPKFYAENGKELLKKYGSPDKIPADEVKPKPLRYIPKTQKYFGSIGMDSSHELVYDSSSETLEPFYFFILDLMNNMGLKPEKLVDTFSSSPGSGHFGELGQRATVMQQQGGKILADINTVLRSVLNIIYDLKEFRIRLQYYQDLDSKEKAEAARLALKQIWMDKVDVLKGNSSIKAMALGQAGFTTLIDAFLVAKDEKDVDKIDLNDRVKRIIKPRVNEFNSWLMHSRQELEKRYELEKSYLKSQHYSLKLYSRWAKPYLKAAADLEQKEQGRNPALVKTFNTILLELTLFGKRKLDLRESALEGDLPKYFADEKFLRKFKRNYYSCFLIDFNFRGIPQRVSQQQHFAFGGRAQMTFESYVLNDDELKKLNEELTKSDVEDVLKLIDGVTGESLKQIQDEIEFFLEEKKIDLEEKKNKDESNPFLALIGKYDKKDTKPDKKDKEKKETKIVADNWYESSYIRTLAASNAVDGIYDIFDIYKKAHGMESFT